MSLRMQKVCAALLLLCPLGAKAVTATTNAGVVEGEVVGEVNQFLGVPYAAPPVGDLRWRAPQAMPPWNGLRSAKQAGRACSQIGNFYTSDDPATFDKPYGAEDCLYLNVWAPRSAGGSLPVLVFFHGGSGIYGSSSHPMYNGARLAEEMGAVVVTVNYRLGVFGSLQSPALQTGDAAEDAGNFYLLDMIFALDWMRANCAAFSCDGEKITISGQSAGAVSVLALLRSPLAEGKFQRAISFSGLPFSSNWEKAHLRTEKLLSALLVNDGQADDSEQALAKAAALPQEDLRDYLYAQPREALLAASGPGLSPSLVADGTVLVESAKPSKALANVVSTVPLMMGQTQDEMTTLVKIKGIGRNAQRRWPQVNGEERDQTVNESIGWWSGFTRDIKVGLGDWFVGRKLRKIEHDYAEKLPAVYVYRFNWENYPQPWRDEMGSFHALDIPFIFGNFIDDRPSYMRFAWTDENREEREALHRRIVSRLRGFVHRGDPNTVSNAMETPLPEWKPWGDAEFTEYWGTEK